MYKQPRELDKKYLPYTSHTCTPPVAETMQTTLARSRLCRIPRLLAAYNLFKMPEVCTTDVEDPQAALTE